MELINTAGVEQFDIKASSCACCCLCICNSESDTAYDGGNVQYGTRDTGVVWSV
jgi:hypothetical protein